ARPGLRPAANRRVRTSSGARNLCDSPSGSNNERGDGSLVGQAGDLLDDPPGQFVPGLALGCPSAGRSDQLLPRQRSAMWRVFALALPVAGHLATAWVV